MKLLRFWVFGIMSVILLPSNMAAEWQWSVQLPGIISNETNDHPQAFLWIPSDCTQVKAVIIGNHNMTEETLFENSLFRERLSETGIALIWITPGWDQRWDITTGCHSTAYMTLRFIDIENNPCLESQARIYLYQTLCDILVNC